MKIRRYAFDEDGFMRLQKDIDTLINERNIDHTHVSRLYTNYCDIQSEDGLTKINGRLFQQYDNSSTLRLQFGYSTVSGLYEFNMYSSNSEVGLTLNSSGEAMFGGSIQTAKDAKVGNNIYLGSSNTVESKTIYFYNSAGEQCSVGMDSTGILDITGYQGVNVDSFFGDIVIGSGNALTMTGYTNYSIETVNVSSTEISYISHKGSGDLEITHNGSGNIKVESVGGGQITLNSSGNNDVLLSNYSFIDSTNSTSLIKGQGYIDACAGNMSWDAGTRTLTLTDRNGATITSVVIST